MKRTVSVFFWKWVEGPYYTVGSLLSKKGIFEFYLENHFWGGKVPQQG